MLIISNKQLIDAKRNIEKVIQTVDNQHEILKAQLVEIELENRIKLIYFRLY